jgi:membrane-associated phospholipid phosphatase
MGAVRSSWHVWKLRPEELLALLFFPPSAFVTARAYLYDLSAGLTVPPRIYHGMLRLAVTAAVASLFVWFVRRKPFWRWLGWIREVAPFLFCIAIYTNLHDTIAFVNSHDVHDVLIRIDQWMFGVQPCVWAQRFYTPFLTEVFSIAYMNYFVLSVTVVAYLLLTGRRAAMREALLGTILCFYIGYFFYVAFPAAPPWLTLASQFTRDFHGGWVTSAAVRMKALDPNASRGAFPSLHCAVTFITLAYAWKYAKGLFAVLLPMGAALVVSTVYLRHHYVIDILAGLALAIVAYAVAPALDAWWLRQRERVEARSGPEWASEPRAGC